MKTNIAQRIKDYYESPDFDGNYMDVLYENYMNNEKDIIERIQNALDNESFFDYVSEFPDKCAKRLYDLIGENLSMFTRRFRNYYVGSTSLESISFGEQEEQLTGLHNRHTGKPYTMKYLKRVFSDHDFYVNDRGFAYYNMSDEGLHVDLLGCTTLLKDWLKAMN